MKVLVVGGGGREHAVVDALSRSPQVSKIYCAPGNAGIARQAECVPVKDTDVEGLLSLAREKEIDLTVVGPEAALVAGIVDRFREEGLRIFGPTKAAARIESSKEFAKDLMGRYGIPTAGYRAFDDYRKASEYVRSRPLPAVLKYDGLAAGKGVVIARTMEEADAALRDMLLDDKFGKGRVVVEDFLTGPEFSFMCFVSGRKVLPMVLAQDHKRAFDGDEGPNTGGMGAYSPLPFITPEDEAFALEKVMQRTADALCDEGCPFTGVLYGGLMKTPQGIRVIEFNARFGDPETEVVLPRLKSDIYDIFSAVADGRDPGEAEWHDWAREVAEMAKNLLRHATVNQLEVWHGGRLMTSVPVLILVLLVVLAFWVTVPLLLAGLVLRCRYRFVGPRLGKGSINDMMDNVSATVGDMVDQVKREFQDTDKK